ncbi:hypothetical protein N7449_002809 [Penicillium cf. viridicatum]|uniref:Uncharacterized protein n=1 Tax=Penicillium cf. viridicatum TaxID=2972119 RepID=A0A9W9T4N0_9EURO|nr:hypothetical protein N7449_002809 [Penicillium cf. viridicatum]
MAGPQSAKRARSNTVGDAHTNTRAPPGEEISQKIQHLNRQTITDILTQAAQIHPDVMSMVDDAIRIIREKEQNRIINFDHYSSSVWKSINIKYRSMRGGAQYDVSLEVAQDVVDTIKSITKQCGPFTNPQTRFNGLSVLRKIGKTIALSSNDTVGHEVEDEASPESLWPKLQELEELASDHCIHPGLEAVLDRLDPDGHRDEEEWDEEEHEEKYEEAYEDEENEENEDDVHQAQP